MPIVKTHSSAAPLLGAFVGGQGQRQQQDEEQRIQQQQFLAQMLQRANEFNQNLSLNKRQQGSRERDAAFGRQLSLAQMQQRERLTRLEMFNRAASQARQQAAQARQLGIRSQEADANRQAGMQSDIMRMGFQGIQNQANRNFQAQSQEDAQAARTSDLRERIRATRDLNIYQANNRMMDTLLNKILSPDEPYPSAEAQDQVFAQHNAQREQLGIPRVEAPVWQEPPPSPEQHERAKLRERLGEMSFMEKHYGWDDETKTVQWMRGITFRDALEADPEGAKLLEENRQKKVLFNLEHGLTETGAAMPVPKPVESERTMLQEKLDDLRQKGKDWVSKEAIGWRDKNKDEDVVNHRGEKIQPKEMSDKQIHDYLTDQWLEGWGPQLRGYEEAIIAIDKAGVRADVPPARTGQPQQGTQPQPGISPAPTGQQPLTPPAPVAPPAPPAAALGPPRIPSFSEIREAPDYNALVEQMPPTLTNRTQFGDAQFLALFSKRNGVKIGDPTAPSLFGFQLGPSEIDEVQARQGMSGSRSRGGYRGTADEMVTQLMEDIRPQLKSNVRLRHSFERAYREFRKGATFIPNARDANVIAKLDPGTTYIAPDFTLGIAGRPVQEVLFNVLDKATSDTMRIHYGAYLDLIRDAGRALKETKDAS